MNHDNFDAADNEGVRALVGVLNSEDIKGHISSGRCSLLVASDLFKNVVQQGHSHFCARSVLARRTHGTMARTPLVVFLNRPQIEKRKIWDMQKGGDDA